MAITRVLYSRDDSSTLLGGPNRKVSTLKTEETCYIFKWESNKHKNPTQLRRNFEEGLAHPPSSNPRKIIFESNQEVWLIFHHDWLMKVADSFEAAHTYINREWHENRYVQTLENVWYAENYMGGSGPTAEIRIERRWVLTS